MVFLSKSYKNLINDQIFEIGFLNSFLIKSPLSFEVSF